MIHPTPPAKSTKKVPASFFRTDAGNEPVREWLKGLSDDDRKAVGRDIATAEYGWPIGMPLCRPMGNGLFEIRSYLSSGRISRVLFCIAEGRIVLLHAFVKKTQKTPHSELNIARANKHALEKDAQG